MKSRTIGTASRFGDAVPMVRDFMLGLSIYGRPPGANCGATARCQVGASSRTCCATAGRRRAARSEDWLCFTYLAGDHVLPSKRTIRHCTIYNATIILILGATAFLYAIATKTRSQDVSEAYGWGHRLMKDRARAARFIRSDRSQCTHPPSHSSPPSGLPESHKRKIYLGNAAGLAGLHCAGRVCLDKAITLRTASQGGNRRRARNSAVPAAATAVSRRQALGHGGGDYKLSAIEDCGGAYRMGWQAAAGRGQM